MNRAVAEKMIELRAKGKSIRSIADELKLSKTTICQNLRTLSEEVENAVALAKDSLLEKLKLDQVAVYEAWSCPVNTDHPSFSLRLPV